MSFAFRYPRADLEAGNPFPYTNDRRMRTYGNGRIIAVNASPVPFLATFMLMVMILNSTNSSSLLLFALIFLIVATFLRAYILWRHIHSPIVFATFSQILSPGNDRRTAFYSGNLSNEAFRNLRLQIAMLNRDIVDQDYDTLRELDESNLNSHLGMTDEEIHLLPSYPFKEERSDYTNEKTSSRYTTSENCDKLDQSVRVQIDPLETSSSHYSKKDKEGENDLSISPVNDSKTPNQGPNVSERGKSFDCSVCLECVKGEEIIRVLPCLHRFHAACIDKWLRSHPTCPICKHNLKQ